MVLLFCSLLLFYFLVSDIFGIIWGVFTEVIIDIFYSARSCRDSALNKMTRRKNSPQKKEPEAILSATELQKMDLNTTSEIQFRSTIIKLVVALEKDIKDSRNLLQNRDLIRPK